MLRFQFAQDLFLLCLIAQVMLMQLTLVETFFNAVHVHHDQAYFDYVKNWVYLSRTDKVKKTQQKAFEDRNDLSIKKSNGLATRTDYYKSGEIENQIGDQQAPQKNSSLIRSKKREGFVTSCKNKKVTSLPNKGRILFSSKERTIIELKYDLDHAFSKNESLKNAVVYVIPTSHVYQRTIALFGRSVFRCSVYQIQNRNWKNFANSAEQLIANRTIEGNNILSGNFEVEVDSIFGKYAGQAVATRTVSFYNGHLLKPASKSLDITWLIKKWGNKLSRDQHVKSRAVLLINQTREADMFYHVNRTEVKFHQCLQPFSISLVLLFTAQNQCDVNADQLKLLLRNKRSMSSVLLNFNKTQKIQTRYGNQNAVLSRVSRSYGTSVCQKVSMRVDFEDLGWSSWIIAPRTFQAYRCAGECPYPLSGRMNSTNHALLRSMMNSIEPWSSDMPCCVPTSYRPLSFLYLDNANNVVLRNYEGMIVDSCGCR